MAAPVVLTLVVPGLIWPSQTFADLTHDLPLPGLCALLGTGRPAVAPACHTAQCVATLLGAPWPLPAARLRRLARGKAMDAGDWLALDPVHLGFVERRLMLGDPQQLAVTADEAVALATTLAPLLTGLGELHVDAPGEWHLRLCPGVAAPDTTALPDLIGQRADVGIAGLDARWRATLNDAQMVLHAHPVNLARELAGRPVINSLWPWGAGACLPPAPREIPRQMSEFEDMGGLIDLCAAAPVLRGLAHWRGVTDRGVCARWEDLGSSSALVVLDQLAAPARRPDAQAWREQILQLDADWFQPVDAALRRGAISQLRIELCGAPGKSVRLTSGQRWRAGFAFWRSPPRLAQVLGA